MVKKIPLKYWLFPFAMLASFLLSIFISSDANSSFMNNLMASVLFSAITTVYIYFVYCLWIDDNTLSKIAAVLLSGIVWIVVIVIVQSIYEKILLKKEDAELKQIGDAS